MNSSLLRHPALIVNSSVNENFTCGICLGVLITPVQCCLGHNFCQKCLQNALALKKECPMCRTKMTKSNNMSSNLALERVMEDFIILRCPTTLDTTTSGASSSATEEPQKKKRKSTRQHEQQEIDALPWMLSASSYSSSSSSSSSSASSSTLIEKCTWQGAVKEAKLHLESCAYAVVPCPHDGCQVQVQRSHLQQHILVCEERVVSCQHCHEDIKRRLLADHSATCDMRRVACPNGCVSDLTGQPSVHALCGMSQHRSECLEEEVGCPYSSVGCEVMCRRRDMAVHKEDMAAHFPLLLTTVADLQQRGGGVPVSCASLFNSCLCGKSDAWRHLKDLAESGDKIAKIYAMEVYIEGKYPVLVNKVVAEGLAVALLPWLRAEAAEGGNVHVLHGLGVCYEHGLGVPVDKKEAIKWYRGAASQGHARAQSSLGYMYRYGEGVCKSMRQDFKWTRLAAEQGHAEAQNVMGEFFQLGGGGLLAVDETEALKWYRLAAEQGYGDAKFNVGCYYKDGRGGLAEDSEEAARWGRLCVEQCRGDPQALAKLNELLN